MVHGCPCFAFCRGQCHRFLQAASSNKGRTSGPAQVRESQGGQMSTQPPKGALQSSLWPMASAMGQKTQGAGLLGML